MLEKLLLLLPGLAVSLASLGIAWDARRHSRAREAKAEIDALKELFNSITARVVATETKVEIFWRGVSYSSAQALHSPHTPEFDALIEKFQDGRIDDAELAEFKVRLTELTEDESETKFRRKMALDVLTLIHIRYEVAGAGVRAAKQPKGDE